MRILLSSDFYSPFLGGTERQVELLGRGLRAAGHTVLVATVHHAGLSESETIGGVRVARLKGLSTGVPWFSSNSHRRYHPPLPDPLLVRDLRFLVRAWRPDVINCNGWIAYSVAEASKRGGAAIVLSARDFGYTCVTRNAIRKGSQCDGPSLERCLDCSIEMYGLAKGAFSLFGMLPWRARLLSRVDAIHAPSFSAASVVRRHLGGLGRSPQAPRIVVVPDMLGADESAVEGRESGAPAFDLASLPSEPFILFVGALQRHKGLHCLLESYGRLVDPPPVVLIGTKWADSPTEYPRGVTVISDAPHAFVMEAWKRSMFGVMPSLWPETFGDVVIEAMSSGKAVIASNLGGPAETVRHEESGLLVEPGSVTQLTAAMQRLIVDHEFRVSAGDRARVLAQSYRSETVVPRFVSLFEEAVAAQRGSRRK